MEGKPLLLQMSQTSIMAEFQSLQAPQLIPMRAPSQKASRTGRICSPVSFPECLPSPSKTSSLSLGCMAQAQLVLRTQASVVLGDHSQILTSSTIISTSFYLAVATRKIHSTRCVQLTQGFRPRLMMQLLKKSSGRTLLVPLQPR